MSQVEREALVRHYLDEVFNRHDLSGLDKYLDAGSRPRTGSATGRCMACPPGRRPMAAFLTPFPDAAYTLKDMFFAGDKGVWRGTWRATQAGDWEGIAATGRKATWAVIIIGRFAGDRLVEDWVEYDTICSASSAR